VVAGPDGSGPLICRGALPPAVCARWLQALGADANGADGVDSADAASGRDAGRDRSRPLASLQAPLVADWLDTVAASAPAAAIVARLGPAPQCNLSHSFLRHGRPPHHWHQDGALRLDFIAHDKRPLPADALLEMLTCWIALTPCGEHAPGLEWVSAPLAGLLRPPELTDAAVLARFGGGRRVRPVLQAGDAVLFDGTLLHRTHLTALMPEPRTSVELRLFRAGPVSPRLAGDRWAVPRTWVAA
jgi:hypothetical protein